MMRFRHIWGDYRRLLAVAKPYRGRLAVGVIFGAIYGSTNALVLFVVKKVWAEAIERTGHALTLWQMLGLAALLPVAMFARGLSDFLSTYCLNWVGLRVVMDLRRRVFEHLQTLSLDFFSGARTGDLISRVTNDVGLVQQAVAHVIEDLIKQPVTLVCVLGYLLWQDWLLTITALILFPTCLGPILSFGRRIRKASQATQQNQASLLSVFHEGIAGMRVVKAFGMEQREAEDFGTWCRNVFSQQMRIVRSRAILSPLIEFMAALGIACVFIYASYARLAGSGLVSIALGLWMLYEPIKKLGRMHGVVQESLGGAERVFEILDEKPSVVEAVAATELPRLSRSIQFDRVTFRYDASGDGAVLEGIALEIQAGSLVAFVGASGAGKTSLLNLIPRFYDPTDGAVRIDGVDIRDVTFKSLRDQIGLVTQETFLFNDTVANNIAYGKPHANREEVMSAARRAHAHDFIMKMPERYDTVIGELGVKLSGGQRQRLAIARAILKSPPILLLDEATSALDTESERAVQAALDDLMWGSGTRRNFTMLVIAHRLSTVQHADRIVVLDKGRIVEKGTHEELLQQGRVYKRLYDLQFNV